MFVKRGSEFGLIEWWLNQWFPFCEGKHFYAASSSNPHKHTSFAVTSYIKSMFNVTSNFSMQHFTGQREINKWLSQMMASKIIPQPFLKFCPHFDLNHIIFLASSSNTLKNIKLFCCQGVLLLSLKCRQPPKTQKSFRWKEQRLISHSKDCICNEIFANRVLNIL